jgi:hypothetical protein
MTSAQVSWWSVHEFVQPYLDEGGRVPTVGTPEWVDLADTDPRKILALFSAAEHWALRVETCQEHTCQAAQAISAAADWKAIANETYWRRGVYIPREIA